MTQILFVCTANRYRSVIAEACFKNELAKREQENKWSVLSAGTWTADGMPAMTDAIHKAKQMGLDIRRHRSQVITENLLNASNLVLVMENGQKEALQVEFPLHHEKILLLSEAVDGVPYDISDPLSGSANVDAASKIHELIHKGFDKICELVQR